MRIVRLIIFATAFLSFGAAAQVKLRTGDYIAAPTFEYARDFSEGLAAVKANGLWGFIDLTGRLVINHQFNPNQAQFNSSFTEGLVAINFAAGGRWGFADKKGNIVINPQFEGDYYTPPFFSEGLACIEKNLKWGFIDRTGKWVIEPKFPSRTWFSDGLAPFTDDESRGWKQGYIDKTGRVVIESRFDSAYQFYHGRAQVVESGRTYYIDKVGNEVLAPLFPEADEYQDGLAMFSIHDPSVADLYRGNPEDVPYIYGFKDRNGQVVIAPQFQAGAFSDFFGQFSEGLAAVEYFEAGNRSKRFFPAGKYGFIDKTGRLVVTPRFDGAEPFSQGLAAVRVDKKYGYIDKTGKWVVQPVFDSASSFHEGAALVEKDGKYGFISR
jgi:hypothetical protein